MGASLDSYASKRLGASIVALLLFMLVVRIVYIAVDEPRNLSRPAYILKGLVMDHPPGAAPLPPEPSPNWPVALATADIAAGQRLSDQCAACHDLSPTATNQIGPPLFGILNRARASQPGFVYSDAMRSQHDPWTPQTLFTFIRDPQLYVPESRMSLGGIANAQDRINLIAYLESLQGRRLIK
jgi:cytochrome c